MSSRHTTGFIKIELRFVIDLGGGVFERRSNIIRFKVGKISEYLFFRLRPSLRDETSSRDYDEAIEFYTNKLHFTLVEDTYQPEQNKRWVEVSPPNSVGTTLLLAKAATAEQEAFVGNQSGGRVFLFLNTDDFWRDYNDMVAKGIKFIREPKHETYGIVAVFEDFIW